MIWDGAGRTTRLRLHFPARASSCRETTCDRNTLPMISMQLLAWQTDGLREMVGSWPLHQRWLQQTA